MKLAPAVLLVLGSILALSLATPAGAAEIVTRNATRITLETDNHGRAMVSYYQRGRMWHVFYSGAINARQPSQGANQVKFRVDYSGGRGQWRHFKNTCRPYDGPTLAWFVTACKAKDGSYWALQAWQRNLPMRGFAPWTAKQRGVELHVSHWSGELPKLQVYRHWTYGRSTQGMFGRLLYRGRPVFGTRTPSATVRDEWARNVSIDTFNSDYGPGWKHDTAIATHRGSGGFCYSFVRQAPPSGYPRTKPNGNGLGRRHRVSAIGPGVTPIVQAVVPRLGRYDAAAQREATRRFDEILGGDKHCAPER